METPHGIKDEMKREDNQEKTQKHTQDDQVQRFVYWILR